MYTYKTCNLDTCEGVKLAEKLHQDSNWDMISNTPFTLIFEKKLKESI